jgi:hypothetical protein
MAAGNQMMRTKRTSWSQVKIKKEKKTVEKKLVLPKQKQLNNISLN